MSSDLYRFDKQSQKFVSTEFADLTFREVFTGPYAMRFHNDWFGKIYIVGIDDDMCAYLSMVNRLFVTMQSLLEMIRHFYYYSGEDLDEMKLFERPWRLVKEDLETLMRKRPENVKFMKMNPFVEPVDASLKKEKKDSLADLIT